MVKRANVLKAMIIAVGVVAATVPAHAETVVRAVLGNNLKVLDPVFSTSYASRALGYLAYDTLIAKDLHGVAKPEMLEFLGG